MRRDPGRCVAGARTRAVLAAGVLWAGCGGEPPRSADDPTEWTLEALPPLRAADGPGPASFGRIADLEIGDDGTVFVLDGLERTVRAFGPEGTEIGSFGGRGRGPGELERPIGLIPGPGGNLWIPDLGNGRLTVFDPEGGLVATHGVSDLPLVFPLAAGFSPDGALRWVGVTSPDPARPAAGWFETRVDDAGVEVVDRAELPFVEWPLLFEHRTDALALVLPVPFSGEPRFQFDPTGHLWYAHTGQGRIGRWTPDGGLEPVVAPDVSPHPVTAEERREVLEGSEYDELRGAVGPAGVEALSARIPSEKPVLAGFFVDDEGAVWVLRAPGDGSPTGGGTLDVYDAGGTPVATTRAPFTHDPRPRIRGGLLAGVVRDSLGVESVVRYRIRR